MSGERATEDVVAGLSRQIRALGNRLQAEDPEQLELIVRLRGELDDVLTKVVYGLRDHGNTDGAIADVLGVTRQAVSARWPGGGRFRGAAGRYRHAGS